MTGQPAADSLHNLGQRGYRITVTELQRLALAQVATASIPTVMHCCTVPLSRTACLYCLLTGWVPTQAMDASRPRVLAVFADLVLACRA